MRNIVTPRQFVGLVATALVSATVACATEDPTAPVLGGPRLAVAPMSEAQLKATEESEKHRLFLESERSKRTYDSLKLVWERFVKTNPSPTASPFLMCDPLQYTGDVKIIGPEGGDMSVGPHKLSIPKGALAYPVVITGEMPVTTDVQVRLRPHGLRFAKAARLELSYKHCYRPAAEAKTVAYVDDAMRILEWPLTSTRDSDGLARATIHHFSGYVVAWSRTRTTR